MIGLQENTFLELTDLFSQFPEIEQVVLFGSRALGKHKRNSDIDLALKGDLQGSTIAKLMWLYDETDIPVNADIVSYSSIKSQDLLDHIDNHGEVIYQRESNLAYS